MKAQTITIQAIENRSTIVSGGVLLPQRHVYKTSGLLLVDEHNSNITAQHDVLARWPDGSIRSVLITAIAPPSNKPLEWQLFSGGDVFRSENEKSRLLVDKDENLKLISVDTGKIRVDIDLLTGQFIQGVTVDGKAVMHDSFSIWSENVYDGLEHNSLIDVPDIKIINDGPIKATIEIKGYLRALGTGHKFTKYHVWLNFYLDSDEIDVQYTMIDDQPNQTVDHFRIFRDQAQFAAKSLTINLEHELTGNLTGWWGSDSGFIARPIDNKKYTQIQKGWWLVNKHGAINADPEATEDDSSGMGERWTLDGAEGVRADGTCSVHNGDAGFTVFVKDFANRWPNALSADKEKVVVSLHPVEAYENDQATVMHRMGDHLKSPTALYHQRRGMAQTYNLKLKFHSKPIDFDEIKEISNDFNSDVLTLNQTSAERCESKALYDLNPLLGAQYNESLYHNVLKHSQEHRPNRELMTGWRNYGDRFRSGWEMTTPLKLTGFYNGAHIGAINYYILYFCTDNTEWLKLGAKETRHVMDIDISHAETYGVKHAEYEPYPAGEIKSSNHKDIDHDCRFGHSGHYHLAGLLPHYYLTGDPRALEVIEAAGNFLHHVAPLRYPIPRPAVYSNGNRAYFETERDFGWPFYCLLNTVKVTNKQDHWDSCNRMMRFMLEWWMTPAQHIQADVIVGQSDWAAGKSYWHLDNMDNGVPGTKSNGCQPWMAGSMFHSAIEWLKMAEMMGSDIDRDLVKLMLYQCMAHVFKYGYNEETKQFYYSEVRKSNGGESLVLAPFATILEWYLQDVKAGKSINAISMDVIKVIDCLKHYYAHYTTSEAKTNKFGFYGYELLFPHDFFNTYNRVILLMNNVERPTAPVPELIIEEPELIDIWEYRPPKSRVLTAKANEEIEIIKHCDSRLTYWIILDELADKMLVEGFEVLDKPSFMTNTEICYEVNDTAIGFILDGCENGIYYILIEYTLVNGDRDYIEINIRAV